MEEPALKTYVIKRLLMMIPTLFGVSLVVWAILALAPTAPITSQGAGSSEEGRSAGEAGGVSQSVKVFRAQYGLDKPPILNTYYSLDESDIRAAVEKLSAESGTYTIQERSAAQEDLVLWGQYAVPGLLQVVQNSKGRLQDAAMQWLSRSSQRVALGAETGRLDLETTRRNAIVATENQILELFPWEADATAERRRAGVQAFDNWYRGRQSFYPTDGPDAAAVREAVESAAQDQLQDWGNQAVAPLVALILEDEVIRDRAVASLLQIAVRPESNEPQQLELTKLENAVIGKLGWLPDDPPARKQAGLELVRTWWQGTDSRWDYSGLATLRVLFLETRFARYWGNLLSFDLGYSTVHKVPVVQLILERLKYSLTLAVSSLILAYLIAVPFGLASAKFHATPPERFASFVVFALYSLPSFFVATLLVRFFALGQPGSFEWIPDGRFESIDSWRLSTFAWLQDIAWHVVTPIFCMTYASLAALSRYAKTGLLNVMRSDYVRTARAKGLSEFVVTTKHAGRNGIIPVITLLGTTLPVVVGGSFIIEYIFSIPGFGLLTVQSIFARDFNVIIGITLIVAILTMIGILLSDLLYAVVDPRISFS